MSDPAAEATAVRRDQDASTQVLRRDDTPGGDSRFAPGSILGGRYRIVSMLGRGGMGEVYRADDLRLGQAVALKFVPSNRDVDRLYREARAGRTVTHPNVCRLYDAVEVDGHVFLSMEYVDGEDLASLLRRIGRFSPDKALAIVRDVCAGLAAAHEKDVIHADLKPANIMIDGRGRARITDFGLAALAADATLSGTIAGTPRYMAPEQLKGAPPSIRSDVYALGLVMAEIFTGRQVIEGKSLTEIAEQQKTADQISIITVVPGLDPRIDAVIRECLRHDPEGRPASVEEILTRLPPRDPLAAAVAAGETPTPGVVIDAAESGEVSRRAAWTSLAAIVAGVVLIALAAAKTMLYARQPVLPPEVLETRAHALIARFAPGTIIRDTASWVSIDGRAGEFVIEGVETDPKTPREGRLLFHFRSGPEALSAMNAEFRVVDDDPSFDRTGMTRVVLDQANRIVEFAVVPPQQSRAPAIPSPVDWMPLLRETAADVQRLTPVPSEWAAPFDSDAKHAWQTFDARTGSPLRIEAASYRGRPVWIAAITPSTQPERMIRRQPATVNRIATTLNILFLIAIPTTVILLATRNVRRGHGDLRGATKLALFVGATSFVTAFLRADHSTSLRDEWIAASFMTAHAAFWGAVVWGCYVAAEPLVRRRWPRMMIGTLRLLAGRWRDPMVGREVLAGVCAAIAVLLAWHATVLAPEALGEHVPPLLIAATALGGVRHAGYYIARALGESVLRGVGAAVLLLVLRIVVRQRTLAAVLTVLVLALSFLGDSTSTPLFRGLYALVGGCAVLLLLTRFGVLSVAATAYCMIVLRTLPITPDVTQWYFVRGSLALVTVLLLAVFGFVVALGRNSALPQGLLDDAT